MDFSRRFLTVAVLAAMVFAGLRAQPPCAIVAANGVGSYAAAADINAGGFLKLASLEGNVLEDSSVLMTAAYMRWHIDGNASSAGGFRLYSDSAKYICVGGRDGGSAMVSLGGRSSAALFSRRCGQLRTIARGDTLCLVLHRRTDAKGTWVDFRFVPADKVDGAASVAAALTPMPAQGTIGSDTHGGRKYTGHFNAFQLSTAIDSATTSLDLTEAVMPLRPADFTFAGATNCLIYVRAQAERTIVPASWKNVVAVSSAGAHLARPMRIADGVPFHAMRPFSVGADSLSYSRIVPASGWNTLVLPFSVEAAPETLVVAGVAAVGDSSLTVEYCKGIAANTPCIFRASEGRSDNYTALFKATPHSVVPATPGGADVGQGAFRGTFSKVAIAAGGGKWLLLAPDGYSFAPAAAGSFLSPFRCGIYNAAGTKAITRK